MNNATDPLIYLNGCLTPRSEAKISVLDRGFLFGDGVYEVVPVYQRRLFRSDQHLARLFRGLSELRIANPHSKEEWLALIAQVVAVQEFDDQLIYLQVTRGATSKRSHTFPNPPVPPTVFIMSSPWPTTFDAVRAQGVACVSLEDQRWLRCDLKTISLLGNVLAAQHAEDHDAVESIQFRDGYLTEGSATNVWIVKNGMLSGPNKDHLILEGIRYGLIEELCHANAIPCETRKISREEVFAADEIMISSATKEILPVVSVDGQVIGEGKPGALYAKLFAAYQRVKADLLK
ncbi:MAG: D-amino acid aminotransferase [Burkholderiales bacterium]|nr:D-amino acid aminotransferase [Burkholderiales bacterium]